MTEGITGATVCAQPHVVTGPGDLEGGRELFAVQKPNHVVEADAVLQQDRLLYGLRCLTNFAGYSKKAENVAVFSCYFILK